MENKFSSLHNEMNEVNEKKQTANRNLDELDVQLRNIENSKTKNIIEYEHLQKTKHNIEIEKHKKIKKEKKTKI